MASTTGCWISLLSTPVTDATMNRTPTNRPVARSVMSTASFAPGPLRAVCLSGVVGCPREGNQSGDGVDDYTEEGDAERDPGQGLPLRPVAGEVKGEDLPAANDDHEADGVQPELRQMLEPGRVPPRPEEIDGDGRNEGHVDPGEQVLEPVGEERRPSPTEEMVGDPQHGAVDERSRDVAHPASRFRLRAGAPCGDLRDLRAAVATRAQNLRHRDCLLDPSVHPRRLAG